MLLAVMMTAACATAQSDKEQTRDTAHVAATPPPVISADAAADFFQSQSALVQAQAQAQAAQQALALATKDYQDSVAALVKACGDDFEPTPVPKGQPHAGRPVCTAKPPKAPEVKNAKP
jgi:hypothetical protein